MSNSPGLLRGLTLSSLPSQLRVRQPFGCLPARLLTPLRSDRPRSSIVVSPRLQLIGDPLALIRDPLALVGSALALVKLAQPLKPFDSQNLRALSTVPGPLGGLALPHGIIKSP